MVLPGDDLNVILPHISKSFGWVDGVSLASGPSAPSLPVSSTQLPLSLLVRKKGDDPWSPVEQFQFMTLNTEINSMPPHSSLDTPPIEDEPVSFPFNLVSSFTSLHRGMLRCSDMVLGSYGTAVWVQPPDWAAGGLIADDDFVENTIVDKAGEALVVALFPGLLNRGSLEAQVKVVLRNARKNWTCLDYDEARGLIALGSSSGEVMVYRL